MNRHDKSWRTARERQMQQDARDFCANVAAVVLIISIILGAYALAQINDADADRVANFNHTRRY